MEGSTSEKRDSGFQIRHVYELQLLGFGPQSKKILLKKSHCRHAVICTRLTHGCHKKQYLF